MQTCFFKNHCGPIVFSHVLFNRWQFSCIHVTVADCAGRPSRTRDLSLGRWVRYQFTKEVTSLARPVHTMSAQRHSATFSPAKSVFVLEHRAQSAPSGFWPPRSCCTTSKVHTVRTLSFFRPSLWTGNCHSHQGALFQPPCSRYSTSTNGAVLLRPRFHTCTDITALWWSHFGRHCNSGWLRRQAESNPGSLAWQASTLPVHQRGNLVGKASTYNVCSTSLCYIHNRQILKSGEWGQFS